MGDVQYQHSGPPLNRPTMDPLHGTPQADKTPLGDYAKNNVPYEFDGRRASPQQHLTGGQPLNATERNQSAHAARNEVTQGSFGMSNLAGALPEYQHHGSSQQQSFQDAQRFSAGLSGIPQYTPQSFQHQLPTGHGNYQVAHSPYTGPFQEAAVMAQAYGQAQLVGRSFSGGPSPSQSSFPNGPYLQTSQQQYMYYPSPPGQMSPANLPLTYHQGTGGYGVDIRVSYGGYHPSSNQSGHHLRPGMPGGNSKGSSHSSPGSIPSTPRGPPRKPKQSGHALWVGNLPSGAKIGDLKDHFSRDATRDIETCNAAMNRFHDCRFQGVRLVCRLRRSPVSVAAQSSSSGSIPLQGSSANVPEVAAVQTAFEAITQNRQVSTKASDQSSAEVSRHDANAPRSPDKYFIMKSLTVEDMELSVRNKIWATQAHNEEALNKAYETAEVVYLIFSANKSGEYFGFARMTSPIDEETSNKLDWAPRGEIVIDDPDIPRSIVTLPTEFAPRGRIMDDSARGTIFWEADPEDDELATIIDGEVDDPPQLAAEAEKSVEADDVAISSDAQAFGKPFKIEWLATNRLPFYRTRGLRNPWNANREVKIARDGTELETNVGRRLVQLFNAAGSLDPRFSASYPTR